MPSKQVRRNQKKQKKAVVHKSLKGKIPDEALKGMKTTKVEELKWSDLSDMSEGITGALNNAEEALRILEADAKKHDVSEDVVKGYRVSFENIGKLNNEFATKLKTARPKINVVAEDDVLDYLEMYNDVSNISPMAAVLTNDIITTLVSSGVVVGLGEEAVELNGAIADLPKDMAEAVKGK